MKNALEQCIDRLASELGRSDLLIITEAKKELAALRARLAALEAERDHKPLDTRP